MDSTPNYYLPIVTTFRNGKILEYDNLYDIPFFTSYFREEVVQKGKLTNTISESIEESELLWIDITQPTDATIAALARKYKFHDLTQEDCKIEDREKWATFQNYIFVVVHEVNFKYGAWDQTQHVCVKIIILENVIITLHTKPIAALPSVIYRVTERLKMNPSSLPVDWILYVILDEINELFIPEVARLVVEVDTLDDLVLLVGEHEYSDLLRRLTQARRRSALLRRNIILKRDIYVALTERNDTLSRFISQQVCIYLRDVYNDVIDMLEKIDSSRDSLNSIHGSYLSQQQMHLAISNFQITGLMKRMSVIGTVLLPLSVFTGMMGMNVAVPGRDLDTLTWFESITAGFVIYAISCMIFFKQRGYW